MVLDWVPGIIGKKVKYTQISWAEKSGDLKIALQHLESARVLYRVHHSSANGIPLRAEKKEQDSKLLFLDIGLMMRSLGLNLLDLREDGITVANRGAMAEQFVGQQWFSQQESHSEPELYYRNRQKGGTSSELDYLFRIGGRNIPVEIKSGTTGTLKFWSVESELTAPKAREKLIVRKDENVIDLPRVRVEWNDDSFFERDFFR